jgi:hypothetical protein
MRPRMPRWQRKAPKLPYGNEIPVRLHGGSGSAGRRLHGAKILVHKEGFRVATPRFGPP